MQCTQHSAYCKRSSHYLPSKDWEIGLAGLEPNRGGKRQRQETPLSHVDCQLHTDTYRTTNGVSLVRSEITLLLPRPLWPHPARRWRRGLARREEASHAAAVLSHSAQQSLGARPRWHGGRTTPQGAPRRPVTACANSSVSASAETIYHSISL
jgi:hypothetical protein